MRARGLAFAVTGALLLSLLVASGEASADSIVKTASIADYVLILDANGLPRSIDVLDVTVDATNRTVTIKVKDSVPEPLQVLVREYPHNDEPRAFQEAYQGLLAGEGLTTASHKSGFKTIVNLWADGNVGDGSDWNRWFRDILNDPLGKSAIDIVAIDHYPGTWCCGSNYRDWDVLNTLKDIARDFGKETAIVETGYSSYEDLVGHGQDEQEAFVDQGMDEVLTRKNSQNANYPLNPLLLVSWYEFIDLDTEDLGYVENYWGILEYHKSTGQWREKLAFDNLRYQVSRWT